MGEQYIFVIMPNKLVMFVREAVGVGEDFVTLGLRLVTKVIALAVVNGATVINFPGLPSVTTPATPGAVSGKGMETGALDNFVRILVASGANLTVKTTAVLGFR